MTSLPKTLHLVDSIEYAETNCFQHQLLHVLKQEKLAKRVPLPVLVLETRGYNPILCCLKQRTLHKHLEQIAKIVGKAPVVIYDQDPWQAYMDDSPYKGVYKQAAQMLNLKTIAVTTRLWAERIKSEGLPGLFVSMWVLPEYCNVGLAYEDRPIQVGFVGSLHPHRKKLFDQLDDMGVQVNVMAGNSLPYPQYLQALGNLRVFIHSEDSTITVDGNETNLKHALWIKDIEAAAQGCFTIRNWGADSHSYYDGIETVKLYEHPSEIPDLLRAIENMDPQERQGTIARSVEYIKRSNKWLETAKLLTEAT